MNNFKINNDIFFAIDLNGIAIVNKNNNTHLFIKYPEAAIWSVLIENYEMKKSKQMLQAILGKNKKDTNQDISQCLEKWKDLKLVH